MKRDKVDKAHINLFSNSNITDRKDENVKKVDNDENDEESADVS